VGLNKSTISGSFFDKEDADHIACSETTGAVLLTTDDDRVKVKKKNLRCISIRADNPLHGLMEMNQHGE